MRTGPALLQMAKVLDEELEKFGIYRVKEDRNTKNSILVYVFNHYTLLFKISTFTLSSVEIAGVNRSQEYFLLTVLEDLLHTACNFHGFVIPMLILCNEPKEPVEFFLERDESSYSHIKGRKLLIISLDWLKKEERSKFMDLASLYETHSSEIMPIKDGWSLDEQGSALVKLLEGISSRLKRNYHLDSLSGTNRYPFHIYYNSEQTVFIIDALCFKETIRISGAIDMYLKTYFKERWIKKRNFGKILVVLFNVSINTKMDFEEEKDRLVLFMENVSLLEEFFSLYSEDLVKLQIVLRGLTLPASSILRGPLKLIDGENQKRLAKSFRTGEVGCLCCHLPLLDVTSSDFQRLNARGKIMQNFGVERKSLIDIKREMWFAKVCRKGHFLIFGIKESKDSGVYILSSEVIKEDMYRHIVHLQEEHIFVEMKMCEDRLVLSRME